MLSSTTGEMSSEDSLEQRRSVGAAVTFRVLLLALAPVDNESVTLSEHERARKSWTNTYGHMADDVDIKAVELLLEIYYKKRNCVGPRFESKGFCFRSAHESYFEGIDAVCVWNGEFLYSSI